MIWILAEAADASVFAGGLIGVVVFVIGIALAIAWLIFPFIVISKCNEMISILRRIDERPEISPTELQTAIDELRIAREALEKISEARNETNAALQWMVNFWPTAEPAATSDPSSSEPPEKG